MTPLSPIHPMRDVKPGRYLLDEIGMLWPPIVDLPFRMVAAVVVKAKAAPTDDVRAEEEAAVQSAVNEAIAEGAIAGSRKLMGAILATPVSPREEKPMRSMARREKPRVVQGIEAIVGIDQPDEDDEAVREFEAKLKARRAQRATKAAVTPPPVIDGKRVAAVYRTKVRTPAAKRKTPTEHALSREECRFCGIPGWKGCEHQLPFEGDAG